MSWTPATTYTYYVMPYTFTLGTYTNNTSKDVQVTGITLKLGTAANGAYYASPTPVTGNGGSIKVTVSAGGQSGSYTTSKSVGALGGSTGPYPNLSQAEVVTISLANSVTVAAGRSITFTLSGSGSGTALVFDPTQIESNPVQNAKTYTVEFQDGYTGKVLKKYTDVEYGSSVTPPANPTRPGYVFSGWIGSYTNIKSNRVILAGWGFSPIWIMTTSGWKRYSPKEAK